MNTDRSSPPLRYVVLRHEGIERPHFDLMFETSPDNPLASWRSQTWPLKPLDPIQSIDDHRRDYLHYEGPVSGNRGQVRQVASGLHHVTQDHPALLITALEDGTILRMFRSKGVYPAQVLKEQV